MSISQYDQMGYAQYKPLSIEEIWAPGREMRAQHDKLEEEYTAQEAAGGLALLGVDKVKDKAAYDAQQAYINQTKTAADELATKGFIDAGRRRQLNQLKSVYTNTIMPYQDALIKRQAAEKMEQDIALKDQTFKFKNRASDRSLDDYLKDPNAFKVEGLSVGTMADDAAKQFSQLSKVVSQKNPKLVQTGIVGRLWTVVNSGASPEEVAGFIANEAANNNANRDDLSELGQMMHQIVDGTLQKHGAYNMFGDDPDAMKNLRTETAKMAIYALNEPKFGQMDDPWAVARAQAAEAAVEPPGKTHKEYDAAFDRKNFDEIDKLVNAAGFKPGTTSQKSGAGTNMYLAGKGAPTLKFDEKFTKSFDNGNAAQQELFRRARALGMNIPNKVANKDLPEINKAIAETLKDQYRTANLSRYFFNPSDETTKKFASAISELKDIIDVNGAKINKSKIFKSGKLIGDAYLVRGHNGTTLKTVDEDGNQISIPFDISKLGSTKLADLDRAVRTLTNDQISRIYNQPGLTKDDLEDEIDRILTSEQYTQTKSQNTNPGYTPYGRE